MKNTGVEPSHLSFNSRSYHQDNFFLILCFLLRVYIFVPHHCSVEKTVMANKQEYIHICSQQEHGRWQTKQLVLTASIAYEKFKHKDKADFSHSEHQSVIKKLKKTHAKVEAIFSNQMHKNPTALLNATISVDIKMNAVIKLNFRSIQ